jgi:hypothetical protein
VPDESELERWREALEGTAGAEVKRNGAQFQVDVPPNLYTLQLPPAPEIASLSVGMAGEAREEFAVRVSEPPPSQIRVSAGADLTKLVFRGADVQQLAVVPSINRVVVRLGRCDQLLVAGGAATLEQGIISHLALDRSTLQLASARRSLERLDITGDTCILGGEHLAVATLRVSNASLTSSVEIVVDQLRAGMNASRVELALDVTAPIRLRGVVADSRLTIATKEAMVKLGDPSFPPIENLYLTGSGRLEVSGRMLNPNFEVTGALDLVLLEAASVTEAHRSGGGRLTLESRERSSISGRPGLPFPLDQVNGATGADLEHVDIYKLGVADLNALAQTERLVPAIGSRRADRRKADAMFGDEPGAAEKLAHFWTRLSHVVREKSSSGVVQSDARFLAARARRRAAMQSRIPWRWKRPREALMLALYSLIGYGERIFRPLVIFGAVSGLIAWFLDDLRLPGFVGSWVRLLLAPLSLFRVQEEALHVSVEGLGASVLIALDKVVGVLLMGIALLAARKVVRASD